MPLWFVSLISIRTGFTLLPCLRETHPLASHPATFPKASSQAPGRHPPALRRPRHASAAAPQWSHGCSALHKGGRCRGGLRRASGCEDVCPKDAVSAQKRFGTSNWHLRKVTVLPNMSPVFPRQVSWHLISTRVSNRVSFRAPKLSPRPSKQPLFAPGPRANILLCLDIRVVLQQQLHDRAVARERCHMQGGRALAHFGPPVSAWGQQQQQNQTPFSLCMPLLSLAFPRYPSL